MFGRGGLGGYGYATGSPADLGGNLDKAQSILSKYSGKGARASGRGPQGGGPTARRQQAGAGAKAATKPKNKTPRAASPDDSISLSGSELSTSIVFEEDEDDRGLPITPARKSGTGGSAFSSSPTAKGKTTPPAAKKATKAPAKPSGGDSDLGSSSDFSISFSEDDDSLSGSIDLEEDQPRTAPRGGAGRPASRAAAKPAAGAPKKSAKKAAPMPDELSMSSDLSLSGSIELTDSEDEKRPARAKPAGRAAPTGPAERKPTATAGKRGTVLEEDSDGLSGDISFSSEEEVRPARARARPAGSAGAKATAVPKTKKPPKPRAPASDGSTDISIEFSDEDDDMREVSAEDIGHMMSLGKSRQQWQPPGAALPTAKASSAGKGGAAKSAAPARAPRKKVLAESDSFSISMTDSEDEVVPAPQGEAETGPVAAAAAKEAEDAATAVDDLYAMLGGRATAVEGSSEGSISSIDAEMSHELAGELSDAAAATDALFESLQAAPAARSSSSSEAREDAIPEAPAELSEAMAATDDLYKMLARVPQGNGADADERSAASDQNDTTMEYSPGPELSQELNAAAYATDALYAMLSMAPKTGGGDSSGDTDIEDSKELQEAAAATDDLFSQLAVYTGPSGDSESSGSDDEYRRSSGSGGGFGQLAPAWKIQEDSGDIGTVSFDSDGKRTTGISNTQSADGDIVFLQRPPPEAAMPHFLPMPHLAEVKLPPGMKSIATQIGTMNEMSCQVGFDDRYRLLFDGCTLSKDAHNDFRHALALSQNQPQQLYIPAAIPGGWAPWGAPPPPPQQQQLVPVPPAQEAHFTQPQHNGAHPAAAAPTTPEHAVGSASTAASSVDDYSLSFEEESIVATSTGSKIKRTVRGYNTRSTSIISESIMSQHTRSRTMERIDSESILEESGSPSISDSGYSVSADFVESHSASRSVPIKDNRQASLSPPRSPPQPAVRSPSPPPHPPVSPPQQAPQALAGDPQLLTPPQTQQWSWQNVHPALAGPQHAGFMLVPVGGGGHGVGSWQGVGTSIAMALAGSSPALAPVSCSTPGFVPGDLVGDLVAEAHAEELFRNQIGSLQQKLLRARIKHVESVDALSGKFAKSSVAAAGGRGSYHYTTLQSTLAYIRSNNPYR